MKVGDQIRLIDNNLISLNNRRSKSEDKIPVGTQGVIRAIRYTKLKPEYLAKFVGHGDPRHVNPKNIGNIR